MMPFCFSCGQFESVVSHVPRQNGAMMVFGTKAVTEFWVYSTRAARDAIHALQKHGARHDPPLRLAWDSLQCSAHMHGLRPRVDTPPLPPPVPPPWCWWWWCWCPSLCLCCATSGCCGGLDSSNFPLPHLDLPLSYRLLQVGEALALLL
jgi:hypothetical protein